MEYLINTPTYLSKRQLVERVADLVGWSPDVRTLWTWEVKGYFSPSGVYYIGGKPRPIYAESKIQELIGVIERLVKLGLAKPRKTYNVTKKS